MEKGSARAKPPPAPEVALPPDVNKVVADSTQPDIPSAFLDKSIKDVAAASALLENQTTPGAAAAEASACQNSNNSSSNSSQSSKALEYPRKSSIDDGFLISSLCPGAPSGAACGNYFAKKNQSMKALVAMCIGLVNDQNQPLINLAQEP
jgi:hypothetical protein